MSPYRTQLAVAQLAGGTDKPENLATVERLLADMRALPSFHEDDPPQLVAFPEATMRVYGPPDVPLAPDAEPLDGPFVQGLAKLARYHEVQILAGMFERAEGGDRAYNTLVALNRNGELVATYRKVHLYDAFSFRESDQLVAGDEEPPVLDDLLPGLRVGLLTCYDLRFPEIARSLVERGAEVLLVPAAWVRGPLKEMHWQTLLRARAIENTVYVVAPAQCGGSYAGNSMVIDPQGITVAALGEQEGVVTAEPDRRRLDEVREVNPSLGNRRYPTARLG
ncbi:MAG: carbon-nitrogen hydrolase family protein [Streptosporangiales bacterium]